MPDKIITFRANEEDLKMIQDLTEYLQNFWDDAGVHKKVTLTDVIFQAILNDWNKKCNPNN